MKKWMIGLCVLCLGSSAGAQQKAKAAAATPRQPQQKQIRSAQPPAIPANEVRLSDERSYPAFGPSKTQNLYIADPVIRALNQRSNGQYVRISGSGVVGAPRGTYGFANGQISLRTTDATSIGGITGNGSVGTGSTPGSVGTGGTVPWVNGKSVYAGPTIWGSARGLNLPDSVARAHPARRPD